MILIDFVTNKDSNWEGLYIDDKLVLEGWRLPIVDVLRVVIDKLPLPTADIQLNHIKLEKKIYSFPNDISGLGLGDGYIEYKES